MNKLEDDLESYKNQMIYSIWSAIFITIFLVYAVFVTATDPISDIVQNCIDNDYKDCCACHKLKTINVDLELLQSNFIYRNELLKLDLNTDDPQSAVLISQTNQALNKNTSDGRLAKVSY